MQGYFTGAVGEKDGHLPYNVVRSLQVWTAGVGLLALVLLVLLGSTVLGPGPAALMRPVFSIAG